MQATLPLDWPLFVRILCARSPVSKYPDKPLEIHCDNGWTYRYLQLLPPGARVVVVERVAVPQPRQELAALVDDAAFERGDRPDPLRWAVMPKTTEMRRLGRCRGRRDGEGA